MQETFNELSTTGAKSKYLFELGAIFFAMLLCFAQLNAAYSSFVFVETKGRKREQSSKSPENNQMNNFQTLLVSKRNRLLVRTPITRRRHTLLEVTPEEDASRNDAASQRHSVKREFIDPGYMEAVIPTRAPFKSSVSGHSSSSSSGGDRASACWKGGREKASAQAGLPHSPNTNEVFILN